MKDIDWDALTFSLTPTDWMYVAEVKAGEPWMPGSLVPYADFSISPAAGVLNYGQGLFEGMKAYRTEADRIVFSAQKRMLAACRPVRTGSACHLSPNPSSWTPLNRWSTPTEIGSLRADEARSMCDPSSSARARCWVSHLPHRSRSWSIARPWDRTSKEA